MYVQIQTDLSDVCTQGKGKVLQNQTNLGKPGTNLHQNSVGEYKQWTNEHHRN